MALRIERREDRMPAALRIARLAKRRGRARVMAVPDEEMDTSENRSVTVGLS